jgi:hypothetical protein
MLKDNVKIERPILGEFMNVICFRYLGADAEELAGRALVVDAGRQRGQDVIEELGLQNSHTSADALQKQLDDVLGLNGTRLCIIDKVVATETGGFEVHTNECACNVYSQGVLIGAISSITGKTMLGKEVGETGTNGHIYSIEPL